MSFAKTKSGFPLHGQASPSSDDDNGCMIKCLVAMEGVGLHIFTAFCLVAITVTQKCGKLSANYYSAENQALACDALERKVVKSRVICVRECAMLPECLSVNFHDISHQCELCPSTRTRSPASLSETRQSIYIDTSPDTSQLSVHYFRGCMDLLHAEAGFTASGEYTVYPNGFEDGLRVYCDMDTDGGGWTVIQRRQDGSVDFYRDWKTYRAGFGNLSGEFWIGNDVLLNLTTHSGWWRLRVELEDWESNVVWAEYGEFGVWGDLYRVRIAHYNVNSTLPDSLLWHNGKRFSTYDMDNDGVEFHCAERHWAGWWFGNCVTAGLNGRYYHTAHAPFRSGIHWEAWKGNYYSMKESRMKIRQNTLG